MDREIMKSMFLLKGNECQLLLESIFRVRITVPLTGNLITITARSLPLPPPSSPLQPKSRGWAGGPDSDVMECAKELKRMECVGKGRREGAAVAPADPNAQAAAAPASAALAPHAAPVLVCLPFPQERREERRMG